MPRPAGPARGSGLVELLQRDIPDYSLVLIDEVESSLHPRAQRRLMRDLAERCREGQWQIVLSTHSPYILEELPLEARAYIMQPQTGHREIVYGVSPEFAMSQMDDIAHHECDLYVEDARAASMLTEILAAHEPDLVQRCQVVPFGAASVGRALGQMVSANRFPRPSGVFLDGDKGPAAGCWVLPGEDAPERVVFEALKTRSWSGVETRLGRSYSQVVDACDKAMTLTEHHDWVTQAAGWLFVGGEVLWQAMTAEWATNCLDAEEAKAVAQRVEDLLTGIESSAPTVSGSLPVHTAVAAPPAPPAAPPAPPAAPAAPEPSIKDPGSQELFPEAKR